MNAAIILWGANQNTYMQYGFDQGESVYFASSANIGSGIFACFVDLKHGDFKGCFDYYSNVSSMVSQYMQYAEQANN